MSQGFNLAHNIAHLHADFIAATPLAGEPEANAREELVTAVSFFTKMVDYICELLRNDTAPWRSLSSIANCLKPFQKMLLDIASRFESTILPLTPIRLACQKLRVSIEKLARVLRSVIKEAEEVLDKKGVCATLKACKWQKQAEKTQSWVEHCLGSSRHFRLIQKDCHQYPKMRYF
ncbi:hypothetical protein TWF481_002756 [Arthrobotrys musiformis]|uniref:Uncharacterized protein n=1 Tax=Arthrobotrys musiformis TaxID=47236 RepID=A0AAV9VT62_9PEZI